MVAQVPTSIDFSFIIKIEFNVLMINSQHSGQVQLLAIPSEKGVQVS
jgi:hypothetical protein